MTPPRGNPRGQQGSARGRGGGGTGPSRGPARNAPPITAHRDVKTIGVKRPGYGQIGRTITVATNHFECEIPENIIHHYDGNDIHMFLSLNCILTFISPLPCSWYVSITLFRGFR